MRTKYESNQGVKDLPHTRPTHAIILKVFVFLHNLSVLIQTIGPCRTIFQAFSSAESIKYTYKDDQYQKYLVSIHRNFRGLCGH